jgi:hypothetical protein
MGKTRGDGMIWISINDQLPKKEGLYLCCGDDIEWNMKDGDPPDTYFLAYFNKTYQSWCERVSSFEDIKIMYWCHLPKLPMKQIETKA